MKLFRKTRWLSGPVPLLLLADFLFAVLALCLGAGLRFSFDLAAAETGLGPVLPRAAVFAGWVMLGLAAMGLYRHRQRPRPWEIAARVFVGVLLGALADVLFFYLLPQLATGRGVLTLAILIAMPLLTFERWAILRFMNFNRVKRRVLVLGAGQVASRIGALRRQSDRRRFEVVGYVAMSDRDRRLARELRLAPLLALDEAVRAGNFDEIVVALDDRRGLFPTRILLEQRFAGVRVLNIVEFLERETEKIDFDVMQPDWLVFSNSGHAQPLFLAAKRCFDLLASFAMLAAMSPVLLLVVIAIKLEDGLRAPVFYRQRRVGLHDRPFELLKFRSMGVDAEAGGGPRWAVAGDERVTRVGRVLRRFRLDELPQVVNVIRGDMSIVGPRPERPEFVQDLAAKIPYYSYRHCVRPGLTGWAQLNFPYAASLSDARNKLKYDLYYIKNGNLVLDIFIFLQTIEVVLWGRAISMAGPTREAEERAVPSVTPLPLEQVSPDDRSAA